MSLAATGGLQEILDSIADLTLRTLTEAAHTHIGLMLMTRMSNLPTSTTPPWGLARAGVLSAGRSAELNLKRHVTTHRTLKDPETELSAILRGVPLVFNAGPRMVAMMQATEEAGAMDCWETHCCLTRMKVRCESALRTACRIAALSMLEDKPESRPSITGRHTVSRCRTRPGC